MKVKFFNDLTCQPKRKICTYLDEYSGGGKALLIFDHGLGDVVEFLPLFEEIQKKYPKWDLWLGCHPSLDYSCFHPKVYNITQLNKHYSLPVGRSIVQDNRVFARYDIIKLEQEFKLIFVIQFYDYRYPYPNERNIPNAKSKLDMCKVLEFGLPDKYPISTYKIKYPLKNENSNIFGFHFGGETDKGIKIASTEIQENIWNQIKKNNFRPFDLHRNSKVFITNSKQPIPTWMEKENTIRTDLNDKTETLFNLIASCKYFIGVLSGPLHLAINLLGPENCIAYEKGFKIQNYIRPESYEKINIFTDESFDDKIIEDFLNKKQK